MAGVTLDTAGFDSFIEGLELAVDDLEPTLAEGVRTVGGEILKKAGELSAWSEKIPPSLRLLMIGKTSVMITAGGEDGAHPATAYMFEIGKTAKGNVWNHPVFPGAGESKSNWHWVKMTRPRRPFLTPAILDVGLQASSTLGDELIDMIDTAIDKAGA
jgi:hypothetical protein